MRLHDHRGFHSNRASDPPAFTKDLLSMKTKSSSDSSHLHFPLLQTPETLCTNGNIGSRQVPLPKKPFDDRLDHLALDPFSLFD